ncbi:sulfite exporter TauE/SafE family protein [Poriferisphaera sp. WC338]|uniref:sulfite exporter TauE/SafE family protein n=1 Tax=Poriferisphaera sp. WC338 TaxID=3425129 RepID=UPI003D812D90
MFDIIPATIPLPVALAALILAAILIGVSKSGFAGSTAILAVPLVANVIPVKQTLGFLLPLLILGDIAAVIQHRHHNSWPHFRWITIGGVIGVILATLLLVILVSHTQALALLLQFLVGLLCMIAVAFQFIRQMGGPLPHVPASPKAGYACGILAGFVSTLTNAAGPITTLYMLEQKLSKQIFTSTTVLIFLTLNLVKVPTYLAFGFISFNAMWLTLICLPAVPIGSLIGIWMHHRVPEKVFLYIIYLATLAASFSLLYKAIVSIL